MGTTKFHHFCPPLWKNFEKKQLAPLKNILPTLMGSCTLSNVHHSSMLQIINMTLAGGNISFANSP